MIPKSHLKRCILTLSAAVGSVGSAIMLATITGPVVELPLFSWQSISATLLMTAGAVGIALTLEPGNQG